LTKVKQTKRTLISSFEKKPIICIIIAATDPCAHHKCGRYAKCIVKYGQPACVCNAGYKGDGKYCKRKLSKCFLFYIQTNCV